MSSQNWVDRFLGIIAGVFILLGIVVIGYFLFWLSPEYSLFGAEQIYLAETAQSGEFIGGVVGAIWSLAGILLFYLALRLQGKEFAAQREELELQRSEIRNQREEFTVNRITNVIYRQLEITDIRQKGVTFSPPGVGHTYKGLAAQEAFQMSTIDKFPPQSQGTLVDNRKSEDLAIFIKFLLDRNTKAHFQYLRNSIMLCIDLIDSTNSNPEMGESIPTLTWVCSK